MNNHFSDIGNKLITNQNTSDSFDSEILKQFCSQKKRELTFSIPFLSVYEVYIYLSTLKNKNSCGFDGISPKILKFSAPYIADSLTYLFNLCIAHNYFPNDFKHAKVIPIYKKGDVSDVNNYRPISLLSSLSKPLERHIHRCLSLYIDKNDLLHSNQSGFRKQHSCETAVCRITNSWLNDMNISKMIGTVFIDLTKVFDLIHHNILLKKLEVYGLDEKALDFLKSYLSNRTQAVYLNGMISSQRNVIRGVPQGSILGPLLFSLYINDLPLSINKCVCDLFADDTSIQYASYNVSEINHYLNASMKYLARWCNENDMVVHPDKTEAMLICSRQKRQRLKETELQIQYNHNKLKQVTEHKLLGVIIDQNLSWQVHVNSLVKQLSSSVFQLSQIKHFVDEHCRRIFYYSFIQSRLDYCSVVWGKCALSILKPLVSLQKRAIKLIDKSSMPTHELFKHLDILPLHLSIRHNTLVFIHKINYGTAPRYLKSAIKFQSLHESNRAIIPQTKLDLFKMSLSYNGSKEWNALPAIIRSITSLPVFKKETKLLLFDSND